MPYELVFLAACRALPPVGMQRARIFSGDTLVVCRYCLSLSLHLAPPYWSCPAGGWCALLRRVGCRVSRGSATSPRAVSDSVLSIDEPP